MARRRQELTESQQPAQRVVPDRDTPGAWVVHFGGMYHSLVDLKDPTRLEFEYVQRMGDVVDTVAPKGRPVRVLHIGGAGLTLARYVAHTRPTSAQVVLEPDEALTDEVRAKLPLPRHSGVKVRGQDGRTGLAAVGDGAFELVIVDAFADARVPGDLVTAEAFAEYARVLGPAGVLTMNLTDGKPLTWTRRVLAGAAGHFAERLLVADPGIMRGRRFGNLVLVAGRRPAGLYVTALRRRAASAAFASRVMTGTELDSWAGHEPAFTDAQARAGDGRGADSAPPPTGPTVF